MSINNLPFSQYRGTIPLVLTLTATVREGCGEVGRPLVRPGTPILISANFSQRSVTANHRPNRSLARPSIIGRAPLETERN